MAKRESISEKIDRETFGDPASRDFIYELLELEEKAEAKKVKPWYTEDYKAKIRKYYNLSKDE